MGMSSSQARMLTLTARMHDIEYKAQRLEAQKLQMANDSRRVYEDYLIALDKTKLQYKAMNADGSVTYHDATLAALENGLINYDGETSSKAFFLKDVKTNAIYISKDYADKIGITEDSEIYTGSLEQFLKENNAPTKTVQTNVGAGQWVTDTTQITNVTPVRNGTLTPYGGDYYTYDSPVENTSFTTDDSLSRGKTYVVNNADDLNHLAAIVNRGGDTSGVTIVLGNDISVGAGFESISSFKGTFNGNGHTISGLTTSLFDEINGGNVTNLNVSGNIHQSVVSTIGMLAKTASNSTISDVSASGSIEGKDNIGGLIGIVNNSTVEHCSSSVNVKGRSCVGGLISNTSDNSKIFYSKSQGTVTGNQLVGGFIGRADGTIDSCYSNCTVTVTKSTDSDLEKADIFDSGGFIGVCSNATISNCLAEGNLSCYSGGPEYAHVCSGFAGCTSSETTNRILNCLSKVNITSKNTLITGFVLAANDDAQLELYKCAYEGIMEYTHTVGTDLTATNAYFTDCGEGTELSMYDCYYNMKYNGRSDVSNTSTEVPNEATVPPGEIGYSGISKVDISSLPTEDNTGPISNPGTIDITDDTTTKMSDVGATGYNLPKISTTSGTDAAFNSNIYAALFKAGKVSEFDNTEIKNKIASFLAKFEDKTTDNSKLYYLNEKVVDYIKNSNNSDFIDKLWSDITSGSNRPNAINNDISVSIVPNVVRSNTGSAWSPTAHTATKGTLEIPNKNTIQSNMTWIFKKDYPDVTETQITEFFNNYGSTNEDLAYLGYINEVLTSGNITEDFINKVIIGTKITAKPSGIDNLEKYTIETSVDGEPSIIYGKKWVDDEPIYADVIDYDADETKLLIQQYNIRQKGFIIVGDDNDAGMDKSTEWLTNMVNSGTAIIVEYDYKNNEPSGAETSVSTNTSLQEVSDEIVLKKAEAKYEADMKRIDMKDRKYDTELAALDNERNAIKQEMETLKTVAKDNTDRTFKLFS